MLEDLIRSLYANPEQSRRLVRLHSSGVFIEEKNLDKVTSSLREFLDHSKEKLGKPEQVMDLLLSDQLYYLESPEGLLVGYVVPKTWKRNFSSLRLESTAGRLISCSFQLHRDDPLFSKHPNIMLFPNSSNKLLYQGSRSWIWHVAQFNVNGKEYRVHYHAFDLFGKRAKTSVTLKGTQALETKRGVLLTLYQQFSSSVPVERRVAALQVMKHNYRPAEYRASKGWIFVLEDGSVLKTCYEKLGLAEAGYRLMGTNQATRMHHAF